MKSTLWLTICAVWMCYSVQAADVSKTIHLFVALCDNENQGIVPVSAQLGNGEDPKNNLYWGAMYGVKSYFKRSKDWTLLKSSSSDGPVVLERCLFKHKQSGVYLIADAYKGEHIRRCIREFMYAASGNNKRGIKYNGSVLGLHGAASLCVYVGHNGLMEFSIKWPAMVEPGKGNDAMAFVCQSKQFFLKRLTGAYANPLLLATQFMAPEAYSIEAAVNAWIGGIGTKGIHKQASKAYSKYQKCSVHAAEKLFWHGN